MSEARARLLALAERCDDGANTLLRDARDVASVLPGRAGGGHIDARVWAQRHEQAALVAREYAAALRREAAALAPGQRVPADRFAEAELVARASEMDGILIGSGPARLLAASGLFGHVAETIGGMVQVPFWQLGRSSKPTTCTCPCDHDGGCLTCSCVCEPTDAAGAVCPCCGADDNDLGDHDGRP
ncbi:hypothetical protein [Actinoplanes sp. NPDC051859]|uniref:hypothetical protein n=1 Tax=Actinoplanes sp. NPDC051859 TaxID=3363909 RepID=UPI003791C592